MKVVRVLDQAGGALFSLGKDGKRDEQIRRKGKMIPGPGGVFISYFLETACWIQDSGGLCGENRQPAPKTSTIWIALAAIDSIN